MLIIICPKIKDNLIVEGKKNKNIMFLEKICNLKHIKDKNNILLIDCTVLNNTGIITNYNYFLEEVFITININYVICINTNNKIKEICEFYNLDLINI